MTQKTRYVLFGGVAVLLVGLAVGLVAYLAYDRRAALPAGLPAEVRYVPATAELVAFANVHEVMNSELRRQLMPTIDAGSHKGRRMMNDFAGVDLETQVNRVVAYVDPSATQPADGSGIEERREIPRALLLVHGTFDQARIEQAIRDHGGDVQEHGGKKIFVHRSGNDEVAVGLVGPELIAMGHADLVRRTLDRGSEPAGVPLDITTNADMMKLIRDTAGSTAWVVGQFDAITRRVQLPNGIREQVPAVRFVSAKAKVDGGMTATIRAEADDKAAADQLRDVVRGFISLARLQAGSMPQFESTLKSIELSGTDTTVQMSFAVAPETLRQLAPPPSR